MSEPRRRRSDRAWLISAVISGDLMSAVALVMAGLFIAYRQYPADNAGAPWWVYVAVEIIVAAVIHGIARQAASELRRAKRAAGLLTMDDDEPEPVRAPRP